MLIANSSVSRTALQGQVAVVTGAGQGIGRETARILAYLGAAVLIAELNDKTGHETEAQIQAEGGQALFVHTDVADPQSMAELHAQALAAFGPVDILVNNAVVFTTKPLLEHTVEEWDRVLAVNLRGAFLGIKLFLPAMLERKRGVIVTMESAEGMPYLTPYLASKVGLRSLAMSLAQEVGEESGVSVYCFGPGLVETPSMLQAFNELPLLYGMSREEFLQQTGGQFISAELCATGLAGTILYAAEFHGQETAYSAGLAKLELGITGERQQAAEAEVAEPTPPAAEPILPAAEPAPAVNDPMSVPAAPVSDLASLYRQALALNRQMEEILRANIKEYDDLTLFQRPIARRMFQQGTGLKAEEWLASAQAMTQRLETAAGSAASGAPTLEPLAAYIAQLERMAGFINRQETEARGWLKDPEMVRVALETLQYRKQATQALADVLTEIRQRSLGE